MTSRSSPHRVPGIEASQPKPSTCFSCTRLNPTTFLIVEDDQWSETPFIYAKVFSSVIVLVDTGCGGAARDPSVQLTSLREFIETYPVSDNDGMPLNPRGKKEYAVVCTHCHYDHIGMSNLASQNLPHPEYRMPGTDLPWTSRWYRPVRWRYIINMGQLK